MLRGLRFLVFGGFLVAVLACNAPPIRRGLQLLTSPLLFSDGTPSIAGTLALLALALVYSVWLSGATFSGWRMSLAAHLIPVGMLLMTLGLGPLPMRKGGGGLPADRAIAAMQALSAKLERIASPCRGAGAAEAAWKSSVGPTGLFSFARPLEYQLVVLPERQAPIAEVRGDDPPGSVYLSCEKAGRIFWLTAVTLDRLPRGRPTMLRDGVGRVAIVRGEAP